MVFDPENLKTAAEIAEIGSGLIVGAEFLPNLLKCAQNWISIKFHGHPQEAIDVAEHNFYNFYGQVNIYLDGLQHIEGFEEKKKQALADPDYTNLFQEAVLWAARTNSEQKHNLLARLVTDRLTAEPDSLRTLAAHMACNAVPQLSPTHLKLLGAMYIIHYLSAPSHLKDLSPEEVRRDACLEWFLNEISKMMPIGTITELDFAHLVAVSCITYIPPVPDPRRMMGGPYYPREWDLPFVVLHKFSSQGYFTASSDAFESGPIGSELKRCWEQTDMRKASLTSAGSLLGMYVRDSI